ncbi:MAG: chromate efflux transporter [Rhodocyclaceae bacterium]|nr:chromate efflux transporter [Rhodocyclaceae bacterium]
MTGTVPSAREVFLVFLRLGLTSFGGPIAHLAYFREEFVVRRQWLPEHSYMELVSLCQFLPGPASSQVGMAVGLWRAGMGGAVAAWAGFTLPSALALVLLAQAITHELAVVPPGLLQGLKVVAVAVVAQAVWGMARRFCPDAPRLTLMVAAACLSLLAPALAGQYIALVAAGLVGARYLKPGPDAHTDPLPTLVTRRTAGLCLALFLALLAGLPVAASLLPGETIARVDAFYRAGSLVFGGGHVVLPLLQAELVPSGWLAEDRFLAGYGAAQAVPGPLFSVAAYLGAAMGSPPGGWLGGLVCLAALFAPAFLLIIGALPFWQSLRHRARIQSALCGVNAAVVGLLVAALYQPLWTATVHQPRDAALVLLALLALAVWRLSPWQVVCAGGLAGWALGQVA